MKFVSRKFANQNELLLTRTGWNNMEQRRNDAHKRNKAKPPPLRGTSDTDRYSISKFYLKQRPQRLIVGTEVKFNTI